MKVFKRFLLILSRLLVEFILPFPIVLIFCLTLNMSFKKEVSWKVLIKYRWRINSLETEIQTLFFDDTVTFLTIWRKQENFTIYLKAFYGAINSRKWETNNLALRDIISHKKHRMIFTIKNTNYDSRFTNLLTWSLLFQD